MEWLLLGRGKTGSLVAEVAQARGHHVRVLGSAENPRAGALRKDKLRDLDVVIDFTTPHVVLAHIQACVAAGKNMVVGTSGWYDELPRVRKLVEISGTGFLYAANFSIGVNVFFDAVHAAAAALRQGYTGQIFERHHVHKKDAPSGTASTMQQIARQASGGLAPEIISFRQGDVVGMHELLLDCPNDTLYLAHDAKSRRGFADGAVRAAEWLAGKRGFFDFREVWREL